MFVYFCEQHCLANASMFIMENILRATDLFVTVIFDFNMARLKQFTLNCEYTYMRLIFLACLLHNMLSMLAHTVINVFGYMLW